MKKLFFLIVLIMFSCSSNVELISETQLNIEIETVCQSGNVRKYEISNTTKNSILEFLGKHGLECTYLDFETTSGENKTGYFVKFF